MPQLVLRKAEAFKDTSIKHVTSKKFPIVYHNIVPTSRKEKLRHIYMDQQQSTEWNYT
jgi:hypothetical protein